MVENVDGRVVRSASELEELGDAQVIEGCVDALIKVLADLHAVDPQAVGLGDFGKAEGYLERQVRRWGSQWDLVRLSDDARDTDVKRLHSALAEGIPAGSRAAIVHGDYRIDNTILDNSDPTVVRAVLDWELSTLGDPLSDAALMCVYRNPNFDGVLGMQAAWTSPLLPSADGLAQRYALASGQELDNWNFYMALAYFKLAIIAAGIDFRAREGGAPSRVGEAVAPADRRGPHADLGATTRPRGAWPPSGSCARRCAVARSGQRRRTRRAAHRTPRPAAAPPRAAASSSSPESGTCRSRCSAR